MVADLQIAVNWPWLPSHPQLVTGVDLESKRLLVLKLLPPCSDQQKMAAQSERHAIKTLGFDSLSQQSALVNCCLVKVCISIQHATALDIGEGQYDAVKMPRFAAGLSQLPQLSDDIIYEGALRLDSALQEMHAANLLHADVKSDNVVLNTADKWHLADYGACVDFGQPIASCPEVRSRSEPSLLLCITLSTCSACTPCLHACFADTLTCVYVLSSVGLQAWYPGAMRNQTADAKYDWGLLVVLIAVKMGKQQPLTELIGDSAPVRVQLPLVLARCKAIVHEKLKQLVQQFFHKVGWL